MQKRVLNPQQQQAVDANSLDIIVSAGAGSGKTEVLRQRIARLIKDGLKLDQLLVITFTVASAQEMKERIAQIDGVSQQDLDQAYINTFDAFFLDFIRRFGYLIGVDNNITIIDNNILNYQIITSINDLVDNEYQNELTIDFIARYFAADRQNFIKAMVNLYSSVVNQIDINELNENTINRYIKNNFEQYYQLVKDQLTTILNKTDNEELDMQINELLTKPSLNDFCQAFSQVNFKKLRKLIKHNLIDDDQQVVNIAKNLYDTFLTDNPASSKNRIDTDTIAKEQTIYCKDCLFLIDFIKAIDEKVKSKKMSLNRFTYTDIMLMVKEILTLNNQDVSLFCNKFKEIMIDEYQDTNLLQNQIIDLLRKLNPDARLFTVGDAKQAIYRFRNASPTFFNQRIVDCEKARDGEVIYLSTNYRSGEHIVNSINTLFNEFMTLHQGQVDFKANHQLKYAEHNQGVGSKIKYFQYEEDYIKDILQDPYLADAKLAYESYLILTDIKAKMNQGAKANEFCILSRGKTKFLYLERFARQLDIPISVQKDESVVDNPLWDCIYDILCCYSKKNYKFHLYSLLHSFLFGFEDNDIYKIFTLANEEFYQHELVKMVEDKIDTLKQLEHTHGTRYMFKQIFNIFPFKERLKTIAQDNNIKLILENIFNLINSFSDHFLSIKEIVTIIETLKDNNLLNLYYELPLDHSSVNAMTIHKSKGLEFKYVYMMALSTKGNNATDSFGFDPTIGFKFKPIVEEQKDRKYVQLPSVIEENYKAINKQQDIHELIRIIYVAVTRSKEECILLCSDKSRSDYTDFKLKPYLYLLDTYQFKNEHIEECSETILQLNKNMFSNLTTEIKVDVVDNPPQDVQYYQHHRASRNDVELKDQHADDNMRIGDFYHRYLSTIDYTNLQPIGVKEIDHVIKNIQKQSLFNNVDNYYQEVEFYDNEAGIHGFIDLMLEKEDGLYIIDYKLNEIDKESYDKQLNTYRNYVSKITNKPVKCFLYSLTKDFQKEVIDKG